jgi:hypothetical protein
VNVELPPFQWGTSFPAGSDLYVEPAGDCLRVVGFDPLITVARDPSLRSWDLFLQYQRAPRNWRPGETGKSSPHIRFANADTDEKLITFVGQFGPVVAKSVRETLTPPQEDPLQPDIPPVLTAEQDMNELRNERLLYHSVLTLMFELGRGKNADISTVRRCISEITAKTTDWPRQWKREFGLKSLKKPYWVFGEEEMQRVREFELSASRLSFGERISGRNKPESNTLRAGHNIICELANAFKPSVYRWGNSTIEGPHWDLRFGIRPLLYFILRREYLKGGGVAVCANDRCRECFEIDRVDQRFCGEGCSRQQRQREYWAGRGKELRKRRIEEQNPASDNRRSRRTPQSSRDDAQKGK